MALKVILESLDGLAEPIAAEYKEVEGKFILQVEDDVKDHPKVKALKVSLERSRNDLKTAKDKLAEVEAKLKDLPEDFDAEQHARDMDELTTLRGKKKKGEPDEEGLAQKKLYEQRITNLEAKYKVEKETLEQEKRDLTAQIERLVADEGLVQALASVGVEKKLMQGAQALLRRSVKVKKDNGEWQGYFETDMGESSIADYVNTWAQSDEGSIYIAKPKGGDGKGGGSEKLGPANPWDTQNGKVKPNLFKQQQIISADPARARVLAQAAGAPVTW